MLERKEMIVLLVALYFQFIILIHVTYQNKTPAISWSVILIIH